jgi:hypothetical protein
MKNFVYLVGDAKTREAVVVDAAWDVKACSSVPSFGNNILLLRMVVRETRKGRYRCIYYIAI